MKIAWHMMKKSSVISYGIGIIYVIKPNIVTEFPFCVFQIFNKVQQKKYRTIMFN